VPTLEEERNLPGLLASLFCGEAGDRVQEVVVSDGESRDRTVELAREAGARVLVGPRGRGFQLARGAEEAAGELLLFVHADARLSPGSVLAIRRAFARDPRLVAGALRQRIAHPGWIYRSIERMADRRAGWGWVYGDSGLVCRRVAYEAVGGFSSQPIFEDLDLSRRLRRMGPVRLVPGARIEVSPRRWEMEGPVRGTIRNWCLTLAWVVGVSPERLARFYTPHVALETRCPDETP